MAQGSRCGLRPLSDRPVPCKERCARGKESEMKSKPKGAKYRNLVARSGVIYYQRVVAGKRVRFSCETGEGEE